MDWEQVLKANGLDRYDRNARLYPAFLCLLPIFVVVALWLPQAWTLLGSLVSLAVGCGLIFWVSQLVRYLGRQLEKRLGNRVGRARSAVLLSHSDPGVSAGTKARYHKYLTGYGIDIPDHESEIRDPVAAHQKFRSAVDWLLEHTRPNAKQSLLHSEKISYGFRRNLLGLKPLALMLVVLALGANAYFILTRTDQGHLVAADVVELLLFLALGIWLFIIRSLFVEDASLAYAQQLLAQCESAKTAKSSRKAAAPSN